MKVIIPALSGFCPGVKNAEKNIYRFKRQAPDRPLYVYGYLINNRRYIARLAADDVYTVDSSDEIPAGGVAVIRTHGLDRNKEAALRKKCEVIDLTCAKVKKVQHEIEAHAREGYFIVIVGAKEHPETRGHVSYAGECAVVERAGDCDTLLDRLGAPAPPGGPRRLFLCAQTTAPRELFDAARERFRAFDPDRIELAVYDSICPVTEEKEKTALRMQREADVTFVVGDRISANANKLFRRLSVEPGRAVYFVEDLADLLSLGLTLPAGGRALLVSSASTPAFIEKEIADYLEGV